MGRAYMKLTKTTVTKKKVGKSNEKKKRVRKSKRAK
jgi:hypothetical protein